MIKNNIIYFVIFAVFLCSCTATRVSSHPIKPPTESFVKIIHTTEIISCKDKKDPNCPIGFHGQMGSGMAIYLFSNEMTVLTAGHVCDSQVSDAVEDSSQMIYVVDHTKTKHQAWPLMISFHDKVGAADLCILWVPTLKVKKIRISSKAPKIGDSLYYIGAPLGVYHPPTVPIFKGVYSGRVDAVSSMVTFPAAGGSSGGAVFNEQNKIVGVVFAANRKFHHISLITSFESFRTFISKVRNKYRSGINNTQ